MTEQVVSISGAELKKGVAAVKAAVASKTALPVLGCFLLTADGSAGVRLVGDNLMYRIDLDLEADATAGFATCVGAEVFAPIVATLADDADVRMELAGNNLVVLTADGFTAKVVTIPATEFPAAPDCDQTGITLNGQLLRSLIQTVQDAAARDDSRPVLNAIDLRTTGDGGIRSAAADGFRLAEYRIPEAVSPDAELKVLLPERSANELAKLVGGYTGDVIFTSSENGGQYQAAWLDGRFRFTWRIIEGTFPDTKQIIRPQSDANVVVERRRLIDAIQRANVVSRFANDAVKFECDQDVMVVASTGKDVGEAADRLTMSVANADGEIADRFPSVALNGQYARDALKAISTDAVRIEIQADNQAVNFRPVDGPDIVVVTMPMVVGQ